MKVQKRQHKNTIVYLYASIISLILAVAILFAGVHFINKLDNPLFIKSDLVKKKDK